MCCGRQEPDNEENGREDFIQSPQKEHSLREH